MQWELTQEITESLALAARSTTTAGTAIDTTVADRHEVTALIDIHSWTDGSHEFVLEAFDGNSWAEVSEEDIDGEYPVVSGFSQPLQWYQFTYLVPKEIEQVRVKQKVTGGSTGCEAFVRLLDRQMFVIFV